MTGTWRVGLLFSQSGATAISEGEHSLGAMLAVEELNRSGGVLGRPIEVVAYDPGSDAAAYRSLAERLMTRDSVSVIFGCHTSDARKAVLRSVERRNGLLWYPSSYEGFEYSTNVIYTGPVANQSTFPLADFAVEAFGPRAAFVGCDYVFPRETNRVMRDLIEARGGEVVVERYAPMLASRAEIGALVREIGRARPDFVFSTLVGVTGRSFVAACCDAGLPPSRQPMVSLTLAEGEVAAIGPERCEGIVTAASYFGSVEGEANARFRAAFAARYGAGIPVSMWSAASYAQIQMFAAALETAGALDAERLVAAALGLEIATPEGPLLIDPDNSHVWLTPRIGRVAASGAFEVLWTAAELVRPDPYLATSPVTRLGGAAAS